MASRISYQKRANADGIHEETPASLKRRIKHVTGFKCKDIIPLEASSHVFTGPRGARFSFYTSVTFTVHGTGYATDFNDVTRAPEYDNPQEIEEQAAARCYNLAAADAKKAEEAEHATANAAIEYDEPTATAQARRAEHYAMKSALFAAHAADAARAAGTPTASTYADAAAEEAARARKFADDAADTAAHIEPEPETIEPEDEPDPYGIAAQFEREQNAQNATRVMNSLATAARYAEAMSAPETHASIMQELQAIAARLTREGYRVDYVEAIDLWTVHA